MESVGRPDLAATTATVFGDVVAAVLRTELFRVEFFVVREELLGDAPLVPRRAGLDPLVGVVAAVAVCFLRLALDYARRRRDVVVRASLHLFKCDKNVLLKSITYIRMVDDAKKNECDYTSPRVASEEGGLG